MAVYENGELVLYGFVGESLWDEGFTAREVISALAEHGRDNDLTVRLNSGGGYTDDGVSIYNALKSHKGQVRIEVDAMAASAASVIAMAGDQIVMKTGALMMIHDPMAITVGNADDHEISRERLDKLGDMMAGIYAERSGQTSEAVRTAMKGELWLTAEEAVEQGYATEAESAKARAVAAFDYRLFARAPKELRALAKAMNWELPAPNTPAVSAAPSSQKEEQSMTEKERADQLAADNAKLTADLAAATAAQDAARTSAAATAADIVDVCVAAGVPAMASALIKEGVTLEQAKARTGIAKDIRAAVDLAKKSYPKIEANADAFIAAGMTMDQVRAELFTKITAAQSPEIQTSHQADTGADEAATLAGQIVANYRDMTGKQRSAA